MRLSILTGSHRRQSRSAQVARIVAARLMAAAPGSGVDLLDLGATPLPLWEEEFWRNGLIRQAWAPTGAMLSACDGLVVVSPEWHGMVPPAVKNLFLFVTDELAHKPGLIVTVSATQGGAYPAAELRMSSYKNSRLCWIPEQVIVRNCKRGHADEVAEAVAEVRERLDYALALLAGYARALKDLRASEIVDVRRFPFGM